MPLLNPCGELMVWYSSKGLVDDLKLFILQLRQNKKKTQMEQMKSWTHRQQNTPFFQISTVMVFTVTALLGLG